MALKFKHQTKAEIPAELQSLYVERDGAWVLGVGGAVEKGKLDEFRTTNGAMMKERDELKQSGASTIPAPHPCQPAGLGLFARHERRA